MGLEDATAIHLVHRGTVHQGYPNGLGGVGGEGETSVPEPEYRDEER